MQEIAVLKFGGTSVKSIARIRHVCELIQGLPQKKKVVIVSAMGDSTDHLIKLAKQCSESPDERELDLLLSTGEQVSISLIAMTLKALGLKSRSFTGPQLGILTDSNHNSARIIDINRDKLKKAVEENDVVVIAGFQGCDHEGELTTLGRGGSDTSAVAIAAALNADTCQIYTDVDGIFSADPQKIAKAVFLPEISYKELLELAQAGAQVMHPRAVELAEDYSIRLQIRNTFKPKHEGSTVKGENQMERRSSVKGVAAEANIACLEISGLIEDDYVLGELKGSQKIVTESIASYQLNKSEHKTLLLACKYADPELCKNWIASLKTKLSHCKIEVDVDLAKVSLIGQALSSDSLCIPRFVSSLKNHGIEIKQVSCSELRVSAIIAARECDRAVQAIHDAFQRQIEENNRTADIPQVQSA